MCAATYGGLKYRRFPPDLLDGVVKGVKVAAPAAEGEEGKEGKEGEGGRRKEDTDGPDYAEVKRREAKR